jgi:uncharacterized membrane protein
VRLWAWVWRALAFLVIGSYPWLTHVALTSASRWTTWAAILISAQVVIVGAILVFRSTSRHRWTFAAFGIVVLALSWQSARESLLAVSGVPHALINLGLLIFFGGSLLPGREPLITIFARKVDRSFPQRMEGYTRSVTAAWAIFFAAQLIISLALFLLAPIALWSLFVNVLNAPLIALMFLAEYLYRITHFRDYRHASIPQMIRAFTESARPSHSEPIENR